MKIFSIAVVLAAPNKSAVVLCSASDLSSFSFYQRGSIAEFMKFFTNTVAERTSQGQRQSIQEGSHTAHVYNRGGAEQLAGAHSLSSPLLRLAKEELNAPLSAVIIADGEYPVRPAFSLLTKILDDFIAKVPQSTFNTPAAISFPELNTYLQKYQDPRQADAIMKVQQELDETKIILVSCMLRWAVRTVSHSVGLGVQHKTIESVLQRGEKINDLVDRSNALSAQSKMFYKTAKKVRFITLFLIDALKIFCSKTLAVSLCEKSASASPPPTGSRCPRSQSAFTTPITVRPHYLRLSRAGDLQSVSPS